MKKKMLAFLALSSLLVTTGCLEKKASVDLKSDKGQFSYAVGHQIAKNMKMQKVDVDPVTFSEAMKDVFGDKEPRMKVADMQKVMSKMAEEKRKEYQKEMEERQKKMEGLKEVAKKNIEIGKKFLEENKKKEGVKVTASGLQYKVLTEGKGEKPKATDKVKVHYKGTHLDGKEFDSSYKRNTPAEFGLNQVIKGWTEGLQLMPVGSKYEFYIPSNLAYGENGKGLDIPGNSTLIFQVELLDILKDKPPASPNGKDKK